MGGLEMAQPTELSTTCPKDASRSVWYPRTMLEKRLGTGIHSIEDKAWPRPAKATLIGSTPILG